MTTTVDGRVVASAQRTAIRAVFMAMFDAVNTIDDWDESRWIDLIAAFNATGRLVFGWPHLESSEGDVFAALDDIAVQLEGTKNAMESTAKEARIALHELHEALGPLLPDDETPNDGGESRANALETVADLSTETHENDSLVQPGRTGSQEQQDAGSSEPSGDSSDLPSSRQPAIPNKQDQALFEVIRADPSISMAAAERAAGLAPSRGIQRMKLLDGYGTLPSDMKEWRAARAQARGVPKGVSSQQVHKERAEQTWRERTGAS